MPARLFLITCLLIASYPLAATEKPSVLFIAIDDLRPELGCYGAPVAVSPSLDSLAEKSVVFDRHYVQVPTCGASRFALLTGRSPAVSGATKRNDAFYTGSTQLQHEDSALVQTLPQAFRQNGYQTALIGKISHTVDNRLLAYNGKGSDRQEIPFAWDEVLTPYGAWDYGWGAFFAYGEGRHREDGSGYKPVLEFPTESTGKLPDELNADTAVEYLRSKKAEDSEAPFFLGLGFYKPHLPFVAPDADLQAVETLARGITVPEPGSGASESNDLAGFHNSGEFAKYQRDWKTRLPETLADKRKAYLAYLACIHYIDRQIGHVLSALEKSGQRENTIIVVWGDHGWHLGEQGIWGKHTPYETALRSALMIHDPRLEQTAGTKTSHLVDTIDIFPTLLDLAGIGDVVETAAPLDGKSLGPLLRGEENEIPNLSISYWKDWISIRTDQFRLTGQKGQNKSLTKIELFDLSGDLASSENVAETHPAIVQDHLDQIPETWWTTDLQ